MSRTGKRRTIGVLTSEDGQVYNPFETGTRELPAKRKGEHRWVAVCSFFLSQEEAEAAVSPGNKVLMGMSNILTYGIGCYDCEEIYHLAHGSPCPAGDEWNRGEVS